MALRLSQREATSPVKNVDLVSDADADTTVVDVSPTDQSEGTPLINSKKSTGAYSNEDTDLECGSEYTDDEEEEEGGVSFKVIALGGVTVAAAAAAIIYREQIFGLGGKEGEPKATQAEGGAKPVGATVVGASDEVDLTKDLTKVGGAAIEPELQGGEAAKETATAEDAADDDEQMPAPPAGAALVGSSTDLGETGIAAANHPRWEALKAATRTGAGAVARPFRAAGRNVAENWGKYGGAAIGGAIATAQYGALPVGQEAVNSLLTQVPYGETAVYGTAAAVTAVPILYAAGRRSVGALKSKLEARRSKTDEVDAGAVPKPTAPIVEETEDAAPASAEPTEEELLAIAATAAQVAAKAEAGEGEFKEGDVINVRGKFFKIVNMKNAKKAGKWLGALYLTGAMLYGAGNGITNANGGSSATNQVLTLEHSCAMPEYIFTKDVNAGQVMSAVGCFGAAALKGATIDMTNAHWDVVSAAGGRAQELGGEAAGVLRQARDNFAIPSGADVSSFFMKRLNTKSAEGTVEGDDDEVKVDPPSPPAAPSAPGNDANGAASSNGASPSAPTTPDNGAEPPVGDANGANNAAGEERQ